jgi:hypothetical protein
MSNLQLKWGNDEQNGAFLRQNSYSFTETDFFLLRHYAYNYTQCVDRKLRVPLWKKLQLFT